MIFFLISIVSKETKTTANEPHTTITLALDEIKEDPEIQFVKTIFNNDLENLPGILEKLKDIESGRLLQKLKSSKIHHLLPSTYDFFRAHCVKMDFYPEKRNSNFKHSPRNYMPSGSQNRFQINSQRSPEREITILSFSLFSESSIF